jgi:8-oxo-dGTP pyrophosphatase MutT (NUDIX family)
MQTILRDIASAIVLSKDGKILMGEKRADKAAVYADCWHIPGGGVDEGEAIQAALLRELKEEIGLDCSDCDIRLVDDQGSGESVKKLDDKAVRVKMRFFVHEVKVDQNASDIRLSEDDDLVNLRWFVRDELPSVKLTPPSMSLFKRLGYL